MKHSAINLGTIHCPPIGGITPPLPNASWAAEAAEIGYIRAERRIASNIAVDRLWGLPYGSMVTVRGLRVTIVARMERECVGAFRQAEPSVNIERVASNPIDPMRYTIEKAT